MMIRDDQDLAGANGTAGVDGDGPRDARSARRRQGDLLGPTATVTAGGVCGANDRFGTLNLALADVDGPVAAITLTAASSNTVLLPAANITVTGSGATRTVAATTVFLRTGTAVVTLTVSDGQTSATTVTVKAGGFGNDTLTGTPGPDLLLGMLGGDTLIGSLGNQAHPHHTRRILPRPLLLGQRLRPQHPRRPRRQPMAHRKQQRRDITAQPVNGHPLSPRSFLFSGTP